jgi:hypothetical protein
MPYISAIKQRKNKLYGVNIMAGRVFGWMKDKNKVKDVFDHIRNFLICGGVMYASLQISHRTGPFVVIAKVTGIMLFGVFIVISTANIIQGVSLIFPDRQGRVSWHKAIFCAALTAFYFLCATQLMDSVYESKMSVNREEIKKF